MSNTIIKFLGGCHDSKECIGPYDLKKNTYVKRTMRKPDGSTILKESCYIPLGWNWTGLKYLYMYIGTANVKVEE